MKRTKTTKEEINAGFAGRLNWILDEIGIPERGKAKTLQKWVGFDTPEGPRKWLRGKSMPRAENLDEIAAKMGCRKVWLRDGEPPIWSPEGEETLQDLLDRVTVLYREVGPAEAERVVRMVEAGYLKDDQENQ